MSRSTRTDYEVLLVELHMEMRAARGEDERADELRQEMDTLWHMLTAEEHAIFADLSEDLYILEGNRRIEPLADGEALDSVLRELSSAFRNVDFLRVLALLRKLPIALQAHHIFVMGRCWDSQGLSRAAVCFYDFANEAEPNAITELNPRQAMHPSVARVLAGRGQWRRARRAALDSGGNAVIVSRRGRIIGFVGPVDHPRWAEAWCIGSFEKKPHTLLWSLVLRGPARPCGRVRWLLGKRKLLRALARISDMLTGKDEA